MPDDADTGSMPMTEPHWPPSLDTGPHPMPLPADLDEPTPESAPEPEPAVEPEPAAQEPAQPSEPSKPPKSMVVTGQLRFLKWWHLVLVLLAVWLPAAGIGLGLFSWWYSLTDKTPAVFVVLVYAAVCIVAGLIVAMAGERPLMSAVAIALMSAVFASAAAAAPLYGHYFCEHASRCVGGVIPY